MCKYIKTFFYILSALGAFNCVFSQCNFTVSAGPDIKVCNAGEMTNMAGKVTGIVREIYWEPPTGLQDPKNPTSKITVNTPGEYILVAKGNSGINLVTNGDFEQGKTGFGTDYMVGTMSCYGAGYLDCEGTYDVINNPQLGHTGFAACKDHTSGGGLMMVLNGSAAFQNIWCQTVPVMPNMDYILTTWVTSVVASSPPIIQANINGTNVGPPFFSSGSVCAWEKYEVLWNSGSTTSADICFLNENTNTGGNDFAIDDISFVKICEKRDTVFVDIEELNVVIEDPGIVNCDRPQLRIDASGSSQGKNFTFKWTTSNGKIISGDNTLMPTIEGPGTYELTICSPLPNCCKKAFIEILGSIKKPDLSLAVNDSIGCSNDSVIIFSQSSVNPLDYSWEGLNGFTSDDQNPTVKNGGTYTVTVIDEYNCKTTKSVTVFENADNPKISIKSNNINCFSDSAFLKGSSTVAGSIFEWFGPNGFYLKADSLTTLDSGVYKIKVTTPNLCIRFDSVRIIKDKDIPILTYTSDTINCKNDSSEISINTNLLLKTTEWKSINQFNQVSDSKIKTSSPGLYIFKGIAENGCIDSVMITISADTSKPSLNPMADTINCKKTSITLQSGNSDPMINIIWTGPSGFNSNKDGDTVLIPGKYQVTVTSLNFCSSTSEVNIVIDTIHPDIVTKNDTLTCTKEKINLFLTDSYNSNYKWKGPNGYSSIQKNPLIDKPGLYVISASLPNGCTTSFSVAIFQTKDKPILSFKNDTLNCIRDSLQLIAGSNDPNSIFSWNGPGGFQSNTTNPIVKSPGAYKFIVTNALGCRDSAIINIIQDVRKPDLTASNDTINCKKTSVTLKAISTRDSLTYFWTGPNGFTSTDSIINVTQGGQYKILVGTPEFCKSELLLNVEVDTVSPIVFLRSDTLNCKVTKINLNPIVQSSGKVDYVWTGPLGFNSNQSDPVVDIPGQYILTVTSSNFCKASSSLNILQDTVKPLVQLLGDTITCIKSSIDLVASILPNTLTGEWTLPDNSKITGTTLKTNRSGNYNYLVTGNNFCTQLSSIVIKADTIIPDLIVKGDSINCRKTNIGILATSKTSNVRYSWTGPNAFTSNRDSNIINVPGNYSVVVTARNGCTSQSQLIVGIDTASPRVSIIADSLDCSKTFANVKASPDQSNYNLIWRDQNQDSIGNQNNIRVDKAGVYTIELINQQNYCSQLASINVHDDTLRIRDVFIETNDPICGANEGRVSVLKVIGGHGAIKYFLNKADVNPSDIAKTKFAIGKHIVYVRDEKNCEFQLNFEILDIPFVQTDIAPDIELKLGESKTIDLNILTDRLAIRSIQWNPADYLSCSDCEDPTTNTPISIEYEVTITDTNGCKSVERIKIKVEDPEIWLPNIFSPNGDGINDWLYPISSNPEVTKINIFQVFDRWGNLMYSNEGFKPDDQLKGWNGTSRNERCNPGVYGYWLEAELINGKKWILKGDVTIVK
ncbi:MAG: T9SS type B sorting domain-containing protein [Saprospiraceae bacterium]|nr:T9SS type B sorting domain-containing protein [Saprospiraceae bacterium]